MKAEDRESSAEESAVAAHPHVVVIVPSYNGSHHLPTCLDSLLAQRCTHFDLEILVVDNGSTDGSLELLATRFPGVRVIVSRGNRGFAAACNLGAHEARDADILGFLNNDMRVMPTWLERLVDPLVEGRAQATSSKILDWEGSCVDFAGGGMNFHGIGIARGHGERWESRHDVEGETLFACGGAMAISRKVFLRVGGFDEDFFAYYEDVDLGWRLWIQGLRILYIPSSVSFHHLSATARSFGFERIRLLQIRNPLLSIFKNYSDEALGRILPAALLLTIQRTLYLARLPEGAFRIEEDLAGGGRGRFREFLRRAREGLEDRIHVPKVALADLIALGDFARMLPATLEKRRSIQAARQREDRDIFRLFVDPFWAVEPPAEYARLQSLLTEHFGIDALFESCSETAPGGA